MLRNLTPVAQNLPDESTIIEILHPPYHFFTGTSCNGQKELNGVSDKAVEDCYHPDLNSLHKNPPQISNHYFHALQTLISATSATSDSQVTTYLSLSQIQVLILKDSEYLGTAVKTLFFTYLSAFVTYGTKTIVDDAGFSLLNTTWIGDWGLVTRSFPPTGAALAPIRDAWP